MPFSNCKLSDHLGHEQPVKYSENDFHKRGGAAKIVKDFWIKMSPFHYVNFVIVGFWIAGYYPERIGL